MPRPPHGLAHRVHREKPRAQDQDDQDHRAELVQDREIPRRGVEHRDDAQHDLQDQHQHHRVKRPARGVRADLRPANHAASAHDQQQIPHHPVDELHRAVILEEVPPPRLEHPHVGRQETPGHQRPVGIVAARVDARHQRTDQDLQEAQVQNPRRHPLEPAVASRRAAISSASSRPSCITYHAISARIRKASPRWIASR
jgi:hypothetical protein